VLNQLGDHTALGNDIHQTDVGYADQA